MIIKTKQKFPAPSFPVSFSQKQWLSLLDDGKIYLVVSKQHTCVAARYAT